MPDIRLDLPQSVLDSINDSIRDINGRSPSDPLLTANEVARESLAVFKWAIEQVKDGYAVVSMNADGAPVFQVETPNLPAKAPTRR